MKNHTYKLVEFRSMRQEVSELLRKAIFDGVYGPGEQIYEAEIAKQLQLSRGPIREALLQLEKESLVQNVFNKGWFVLQLTPERISEITSLRVILEALALHLARDHASQEELKQLEGIQRKMILAFEQGKIPDAVQMDFDFHRHIWSLAGHQILKETLNSLTTPYFAYYKMAKIHHEIELVAFRSGFEHHQTMIEFLSGRSEQSAELCIRNHFTPVTVDNWSALLDAIHHVSKSRTR